MTVRYQAALRAEREAVVYWFHYRMQYVQVLTASYLISLP